MLTTIGRYYDPWEAHILRARLEAEGVPASVAHDQHIIANWPMSIALGGAALQVPSANAEQALEILSAYQSGALEHDLLAEYPEAEDACPACNSTHVVSYVPLKLRALTVLTYFLASAPFPPRASSMRCSACGWRWKRGD